ncbi:MAG TPA: RNA polymerase sigma factor [Gemmatimonadaceae bacterium]|nr:RNA polymerase sigma factor [Gemmatimonadaceae bacterium]
MSSPNAPAAPSIPLTPPTPDAVDALAPLVREMRNHFSALVDAHRPALWRYCLRLTGSPWDAEDLPQDTLLRAFAQLPKFYQPIDARGYLFRIASNAWIDTIRRARRAPETLDLDVAARVPASAPPVDAAEVHAAMEALVHALPPRQWVVVLLAEAFGFTAREIAGMLETTEGAVKAALHRARPARALLDHRAARHRGARPRPAAVLLLPGAARVRGPGPRRAGGDDGYRYVAP